LIPSPLDAELVIMSLWSQPALRFGLLGFGLSGGLFAWLTTLDQPLHWVLWWCIAVSAVTFLVFGYDKAISGRSWVRVPERTLLWLVMSGGTPGALAGMSLFRHKTIKASFRNRFWVAVSLQVLLVAGWLTRDYWLV